MDTPAAAAIPIVGKELKQNPKPDDAVAWEENTRQWFNQEQLVEHLEGMVERQTKKYRNTDNAERARGAHLMSAATAKLLKSVIRSGAEARNIKEPIKVGQAIVDARKGLPGYEEALAAEQAAEIAAADEEEAAGRVPRDQVLEEGTEQPSEDAGKKQIA